MRSRVATTTEEQEIITIQSIDIKKIEDLSDAKTIDILDTPELHSFDICRRNNISLPKLETLNFRQNPKLETVDVSEQTKLERITFDKKNQLKIIKTDGCFSLSEIDFDQDLALQSPKQLEEFSTKDCRKLRVINLNNSTKLKHTNFSNCFGLEELYLDGASDLKTLNLSTCIALEDTRLHLPRSLNFLTDIDLSGCTGLRKKIVDIVQQSTNAKVINIGGCERMTNEDVEEMHLAGNYKLETLVLPQHLVPEFTELDLSGCSSLTKLDFKPESETLNFGKLKTLNLTGTKLSADEIIKIIESSPSLETLDLSSCNLHDSNIKKILKAIPNKEKLKTLKLDQIATLKILPLSSLSPFSNLEEISLAGSGLQNFTGDEISLPKLTKIDLSGCKISGDNIAKITYQASSLRKLFIDTSSKMEFSRIIEHPEELEELGIKNYQETGLDLGECKNLRVLDLSDSKKLRNFGLKKFPFLKQLSLFGSSQLTKSNIEKVLESTLTQEGQTRVGNIETINLGATSLLDYELQQIFQNKGLSKLKDLKLPDLKIKPVGNNNYTLTIPKALTNLSKIDLNGSNLTSLSIATPSLKEIECSNCKSLESIAADPELQDLQEANFQGCKKLSGDVIFDFIEGSLPKLEMLNVIGCQRISIETIQSIFAENKIEQLYVDEDLKQEIFKEVRAGRLKLPDSLLVLSSNFDKDVGSEITESDIALQSSEINQLRLQYAIISERLERLEASTIVTILPGELEIKNLDRIQQERDELRDSKLYQEFILQFSAKLRITQLTSNPNISMTSLVADTTATAAAKIALRRIPIAGMKLAEELSIQKSLARGEDVSIQRLYHLTREESLNALTDCLARTLLLNPEIIELAEKLSDREIITDRDDQSIGDDQSQATNTTSRIDNIKTAADALKKSSMKKLISVATDLKKSSAQHDEDTRTHSSTSQKLKSTAKAAGSRVAKGNIGRIVDAVERPEDLASRFSNYRYKESDKVDCLMVSLLTVIFSKPIEKGTTINYELVEDLTRGVKQDLQQKLSKQEGKQRLSRSRSRLSVSSDQPSSSQDLTRSDSDENIR